MLLHQSYTPGNVVPGGSGALRESLAESNFDAHACGRDVRKGRVAVHVACGVSEALTESFMNFVVTSCREDVVQPL